jgi:negative regulator of sigma E activity
MEAAMTEETRPSSDDEALSGLIDGTLPSDEMAALRSRLKREPALAARLASMEHATNAVRDAYRGVIDEPLPERTLALLRARTQSERVVTLPTRRRAAAAWFPQALAAGIALAVGLGVGLGLGQRSGETESSSFAATGAVAPGSRLHALLESVPSGEPRALDGALTAEARLTFRTLDGDWCRELAVTSATIGSAALACRRDGDWRVELLGIAAASGELYRPAGAGAPFERAIDALIDGEALEPDAEHALLEGGWRRD